MDLEILLIKAFTYSSIVVSAPKTHLGVDSLYLKKKKKKKEIFWT